ncbi:TetR/AcrR family transcriptional regulator [Celeribacter indicus]|uniref:TetR family transcriptional regulator n=1 Tax=Celeribacter indicus TaxID=1208324 RepID=A0A0B5DYN2_9RHOB|nr:TetR/AcrR family transcriptional regulator [Celeribacter indicus]AJE45831.1 TetR family transcriptional regulator [Celeribacter indicus]SDW61690.1 transcriptional regulator, TetR family [Celeribacter indicus]
MDSTSENTGGLRARKRRETRERIVEAGLRLFVENGYEATTLDMIAAAAGISRRTFFYYFRSKEEVLLARDGSGFPQALRGAMREQPPDQTPLAAALDCFLHLASRYETRESVTIDRLLRSTEALRARKTALFIEIEQVLFETMCEIWPAPDRRDGLRVMAMMAAGALRLALDERRTQEDGRPLADCLRRNFALLESPAGPGAATPS